MEQTSTLDLLTLHVYGETSLEEREHLAQLLAEDDNLQEQLMELVQTKRELNSFMKKPSDTSLRIIMEHSRKSEQLQEI
jgi:anti-sigma factor RsiW